MHAIPILRYVRISPCPGRLKPAEGSGFALSSDAAYRQIVARPEQYAPGRLGQAGDNRCPEWIEMRRAPDDSEILAAGLRRRLNSLPMSFWVYKKAIDLFFALLLLPGLLFCMLILLVLNPLRNPGPMFFRQTRVGLNGEHFTILKFRTVENPGTEMQLSPTQKSRLNRLGAFMRDTRVDEVPQILNVLKGEMSMIGPRPEQVTLYLQYSAIKPRFALRQMVKPGITGLAQLKHGYTDTVTGAARKLNWDLLYLKRMGFGMETFLVWWTFRFVMAGLGKVFWRKLTEPFRMRPY